MSEALSADIKAYHRISPRHVLVLEADLTHNECVKVFAGAEKNRLASNELVRNLNKRLVQLRRTKRFRSLRRLYWSAKDKGDEKEKVRIARQMEDMIKEYGLKKYDVYALMDPIAARYGVNSCIARGRVDEIYMGLQRCLYNGGTRLHIRKPGELPSLRGQQTRRGISLTPRNCRDALHFIWEGMKFGALVKDRFQREEVEMVMHYLKNRNEIDAGAAAEYKATGRITDTFRPCYCTLTPKRIRGKMRVYVTVVLEGRALPKYDSKGEKRHQLGKGTVGVDIGTQSVAIKTDRSAYMINLGERGLALEAREKEERRIQRRIDRSMRAVNKDNYEPDGTIKKGCRMKKSENCRKLFERLFLVRHTAALNRKYAIREAVNGIRALGDVIVTEPRNSAKLAKKAKEDKTDIKGRCAKKKRFGRSIKNRTPGYFQEYCQSKFERTGGEYVEVGMKYRASQYDHTSGEYVKRKLSSRMFRLSDGSLVQRDMYSAFLLSNMASSDEIDRNRCFLTFDSFFVQMNEFIEQVKMNGIRIRNSGIRIRAC